MRVSSPAWQSHSLHPLQAAARQPPQWTAQSRVVGGAGRAWQWWAGAGCRGQDGNTTQLTFLVCSPNPQWAPEWERQADHGPGIQCTDAANINGKLHFLPS